jgi:hypothetical protein
MNLRQTPQKRSASRSAHRCMLISHGGGAPSGMPSASFSLSDSMPGTYAAAPATAQWPVSAPPPHTQHSNPLVQQHGHAHAHTPSTSPSPHIPWTRSTCGGARARAHAYSVNGGGGADSAQSHSQVPVNCERRLRLVPEERVVQHLQTRHSHSHLALLEAPGARPDKPRNQCQFAPAWGPSFHAVLPVCVCSRTHYSCPDSSMRAPCLAFIFFPSSASATADRILSIPVLGDATREDR